MTRDYTAYMVLSVSDDGCDHGSWTEHSSLEESQDCARSVNGSVWYRTMFGGSVTMTRLED